MPLMKNLIFALFMVFAAAKLAAQPASFHTFSVAEGLPQSQVWCATGDARGFLWFGTQGGGLARFDGQKFEVFGEADGLPSSYVSALFFEKKEKKERFWVGTERGLCRFENGKFTAIAGLEKKVNAISVGHFGQVLAATDAGLFVMPSDSFFLKKARFDPVLDKKMAFCFFQKEKKTWVGAENGLWELGKNARQVFDGGQVRAIAESTDGRFLLAVWGKGIYFFDPKNELAEPIAREGVQPETLRPLAVFQKKDGPILVGTQDFGLVQIDPKTGAATIFSEKNGLPHNHVRAITADHAGQIWVATSGGGVAVWRRQDFQHFSKENGLAGSRIYAICERGTGEIWASVSQTGIQKLGPVGFEPPLTDSLFAGAKIKTLCTHQSGAIWAGTEGKGIAIFDTSGIFHLTTRDGLPSDWVQKLALGPNGLVWGASFSEGLFSVDRRGKDLFLIKKYGNEAGLPSLSLTSLIAGSGGEVWFGTQNGEICGFHEGSEPTVFSEKNGLPAAPIRSLALDRRGRIWAAAKGSGLFFGKIFEKETHFQPVADASQSLSKNIYLLTIDGAGNLWAGAENGVFKINFDEKGNVAAIRHFTKNDGFEGIETCHDAALCDRSGGLWFGTMNGLEHFTGSPETVKTAPPTPFFEKIRLFYRPLEETAWANFADPEGGILPGLSLPHGQNHLSFSFRAVSQARPDGLVFRWKLGGAEADWSPPSDARSVNYANLPPGDYAFFVQASTDGQDWGEAARADFSIKKPFWQTGWFRFLAVGGLLAGLYFGTKTWAARLKKREKDRREVLETQNRMLQLEQKALQLQMNPHFIFNALTGIQSLVAEKDFAAARAQIQAFAQLMRSILNNSRRTSITLREEADTLERYLKMEQFCQREPFGFEVKISEKLAAEEVELPPMLLQPFVENAVIHGVSHLARPGFISVLFEKKDDLLVCRIRDNGIGREKAAALRAEKTPGHQSVALDVTRERLEGLRGVLDFKPLEINDLRAPDGKIEGTEAIIRLPLNMNF